MSNDTPTLKVTVRTEKGKGASRRARREGLVPAVMYGHATESKHLLLPYLELAAILRNGGLNSVIDLDIDGEKQLVLTKQVDVHPLRNYLEHLDLTVIRRGEKVTVEVPVEVEGDAAPGTLVVQDATYVEIEADALSIPEIIAASVEGIEAGNMVTAADLELPKGVTLISDPETAIVAVNEAPSAEELEAELDEEALGEGDAEAPAEEPAAGAAEGDEAAAE
ncbi:50S ribosomal protein L25/general stress protein Ctc [Gordonia zhaorongruii]|uniref:50S ribosomal protein L25/general stress protein Ctc n=1 Tax=Gordonia zhaorongruii TaxID=2597659 RepID=UPI00104AB63E|nr:50S ribosomal protein L25/general stress protein Ctc [Gordonia zhaorongruii]